MTLHLVFDANQDYQVQAIEAVLSLFQGLPVTASSMDFVAGTGFAVKNNVELHEDTLLRNLQSVQDTNRLPRDDHLEYISQAITTATGPVTARFPNFSIEMETGTGKTYVYLRTALELRRRYGLRKFIIVVPSVAIREGVITTLRLTTEHFRTLYDNMPFRYAAYDSQNLSQVRQFAASDSLEFLVMTIDSFNKALKDGNRGNVIFRSTDRLQGGTPVHFLQATRPVLILDEPQNMKSDLSIQALANLHPLLALRYSATHPRVSYNHFVYKLTPYDAYRQGLVKKVAVAGAEQQGETTDAYVRLEKVTVKKRSFTATLTVHARKKDGTISPKLITVTPGESLEQKTNRSDYAALIVDTITDDPETIKFSTGLILQRGIPHGPDKEALFKAQIRYTVEKHFERQRALREHGIKVLSLFFIDRVENYTSQDGIIKRLFTEAYNELRTSYPEWQSVPVEKVQGSYFASKKNRAGETIYEDTSGDSALDQDAYDLIMKDKERLLSFDEPTSFIFSHSALREGWDNPNVFQICTLNTTRSETRKRQEIGRGIRLPVNQDGVRIRDERINILTVVANQSYESYVREYQEEVVQEYGTTGLPPRPANARERLTAHCRKAYLLKPAFKELWNRIKHKTRYSVTINTPQLITDVVSDLDAQTIRPARITITTARMDVDQNNNFTSIMTGQSDRGIVTPPRLPNLLAAITEQLERTTPPVRVTRNTLLSILTTTTLRSAALSNPQELISTTTTAIKTRLSDQLVNGIQYEKTEEWYDMTLLEADIPLLAEYIEPSKRPDGTDGSGLYDAIGVDSETERTFVRDLERRDDVKLYIKLPDWFTVNTPIGTYNPDWAVVITHHDDMGRPTDTLYLVAETKSDTTTLRPDEKRKTICGARHFNDALHVPYKVITSASELP